MTLAPALLRRGIYLIFGLSISAFSAQWNGFHDQIETPPRLVVNGTGTSMILDFDLPGYYSDAIDIGGVDHVLITAPEMTPLLNTGAPDLPKYYRSVIIPDDAHMRLRVEVLAAEDILVKDLVPSKGNLLRDVDPAQVPFQKGTEYQKDRFYPENIAQLSDPYVIRDVRGQVVQIHPFRYNPVSGVLRVYTRLRLTLEQDGQAVAGLKHKETTGIDRGWLPVYENHFINFDQNSVLYDMPAEIGRLLIITPDAYESGIVALADWKRTRGLPVEVLPLSAVGNNAIAIKATVQNYYDSPAGLTFLLLIGDAADVAPAMSAGAASDPSYALLDGGNGDQYPDIFVGRLSGSNLAQIQTQVAKILAYETDPDPQGDWYAKAIGLASDQGAGIGDDGESDIQHMNNIRTDLLGYGYTPVNQIYDPGASASAVTNAVNEGRGLINYVGHGSNTAWSTTGFSNSNVTALNNTGKLPVIFSVACVNGNFQSTTCFAEAWLRAGSAAEPKGAVAFYGSTINQSWAPPMCAQDEFNDLLVADANMSIGALMYAASAQMIDEYGSGGFEMYATWHIFGDPSMPIRTRQPQPFVNVSAPDVLILGSSECQISVPNAGLGTVTLSRHGTLLASAPLSQQGENDLVFQPLAEIDTCLLTITGQNRIPWQQELMIIAPDGPYLITTGCSVDDMGEGNGNGRLEFGETVDLDLNIYNVGADTAQAITVQLDVDDPYVTLAQETAMIISLAPESTQIAGPFSLSIAETVPDGHQVSVGVQMDGGDESWTSNLTLTLHAPQIQLEDLVILDNGNDRLDIGETAQLGLCLSNLGGADLSSATLQLETSDPFVDLLTTSMNLADILAGGLDTCQFQLATQYATPPGHQVNFSWTLDGSNNYHISGVFTLPVGLIIEDFESGNFESFDWLFSGYQNWNIDVSTAFEGGHAARSGSIGNNQNSEMSLTISIDEASEVSFYYKVSSEVGSDGLQFMVDGQLLDAWEGEIPWSAASYPLTAGDHELAWKYLKNFSGSSGQDCAWIDFITLPNMAMPGTIIGDVTADTQINVQDVVRLVNIILGQGNAAAEYELYCGDVNGDAVVDIGDLVLLVNLIMGDQLGRVAGVSGVTASVLGDELVLSGDTPIQALRMHYSGTLQPRLPEGYQVVSASAGASTQTIAYCIDGSKALPRFSLGRIGSDLNLYELQAADRSGTVMDIETEGIGRPQRFRLYANYPNPFNPTTTISFDLPETDQVRVQIFDLQGRSVVTLLDQTQAAGHYQIPWQGLSAGGEPVSSGMYFCHLRAGSQTRILKMLLLK